jgi:hypothetical protein
MRQAVPLRSVALAALLALAGCGASERTKCEQVAKRGLACSASLTRSDSSDRIADEVSARSCDDPEVRAINARAAACLPEPTCAAFDACVQRTPLRDPSLDGKDTP